MIQVFSNRKDKKHQYRFTDLSEGTDINGIGFDPIEVAISRDGIKWESIYDQINLEMFMLLIRLMLLKQSQQMIIKKSELMTVRV